MCTLPKNQNQNFLFRAFLLISFFFLPSTICAAPVLNFSDIDSGPKTGNTDGAGGLLPSQHGAIVTVWGNNLGSFQGDSKIYIGDVEAAHVYYWKDADGQLPGGPADLKTYHQMQEIAFSVPASVADGATTIKVKVGGINSTTIPFNVRKGNIYFINSSGNDSSGNGSWGNPWLTLPNVMSGNGKISAGDIVYSLGVGSISGISIGRSGPIKGSALNPISLISYPNTLVSISGQGYTGYVIFNYNFDTELASEYINLSKLKITAAGDNTGTGSSAGIRVFKGNRVVGVEITGPTVYGGYAGAIAGNNIAAGGGKYYGVYIHNYGTDNHIPYAGNTGSDPSSCAYSNPSCKKSWDVFQHLYYISNRFSTTIDAYEIAWNHLANNPIFQGIHIYDQGYVGGWNGTMKIHHNVIKNQRGNAINIDLQSTMSINPPIEIHNNIIISEISDTYNFRGMHILCPSSTVYIYNNTIYGYNSANYIRANISDYRNNILVDIKGIPYHEHAPTLQSNNLFFSTFNSSPPPSPSWASGAVATDPLFIAPTSGNFKLKSSSPVKYKGTDSVLTISPTGFHGELRKTGSVSIGAVEYSPEISTISPGN